jgi:carboxymethylenebutenolidase
MTPQLSRLPQGFAAAVLPITAATITTNSDGLTAGEVDIPTGDLRIPAYRAKPAAGTSFPTILVVQEIFGIHEHIKDLCRRLAKSGYLAVAPYLYEREGDVSGLEAIEEIRKVVSRVPDAQVMRDLDATVDWTSKDGGDTSRLAATGFCWGGRIVWLYAAHSSRLKAGAAWYGRLAGPTTELQPKNPVDIASDLKPL